MRTIGHGLCVTLCIILLASCSGGGFTNKTSREYEKAVTRCVDSSKYIDLTMPSANANSITKENFLTVANGVYKNGDAYIKFNEEKGVVTLFNPTAKIPGQEGLVTFETTYPFTVFVANKNCLYVQQANRKDLIVKINGNELKGNEIPDLICCVPFYGYGYVRLEVSPIMNGYIAMPSGTYWGN